jgi:hypothetical protein
MVMGRERFMVYCGTGGEKVTFQAISELTLDVVQTELRGVCNWKLL